MTSTFRPVASLLGRTTRKIKFVCRGRIKLFSRNSTTKGKKKERKQIELYNSAERNISRRSEEALDTSSKR